MCLLRCVRCCSSRCIYPRFWLLRPHLQMALMFQTTSGSTWAPEPYLLGLLRWLAIFKVAHAKMAALYLVSWTHGAFSTCTHYHWYWGKNHRCPFSMQDYCF